MKYGSWNVLKWFKGTKILPIEIKLVTDIFRFHRKHTIGILLQNFTLFRVTHDQKYRLFQLYQIFWRKRVRFWRNDVIFIALSAEWNVKCNSDFYFERNSKNWTYFEIIAFYTWIHLYLISILDEENQEFGFFAYYCCRVVSYMHFISRLVLGLA